MRKDGWRRSLTLFLAGSLFVFPLRAQTSSLSPTQQVAQCQASLKKLSSRLSECATRTNQAYYGNLYQQIQDFLKEVEDFPDDAAHEDRCRNLLQVIQDITGHHAPVDLGPLPDCSGEGSPRGQRSYPILETTPKRDLRVRYVYEAEAGGQKKQDAEEETSDEGPLMDPPDAFSSPRSSKKGQPLEPEDREE